MYGILLFMYGIHLYSQVYKIRGCSMESRSLGHVSIVFLLICAAFLDREARFFTFVYHILNTCFLLDDLKVYSEWVNCLTISISKVEFKLFHERSLCSDNNDLSFFIFASKFQSRQYFSAKWILLLWSLLWQRENCQVISEKQWLNTTDINHWIVIIKWLLLIVNHL